MKKSALLRLKALLALATLTDAEKTELTTLKSSAKTAKIECDTKSLDTAIEDAEDDTEEMTEDEVKETVTKAVKEAMASHKGVSSEDLEEHVTKALAKANVTEDKIRSIMGDVLKEHTKSAPKMEFPIDGNGPLDFPVEHRAGNLSIAQKQLLNVCLMKVSEDALAECGTKRPSNINEGLTDGMIRRSKSASDRVVAQLKVLGRKGLTTGGSGTGAELVYVDLATELQQRLYLTSEIAQIMQSREIAMPTDPFKLPIKLARTAFAPGTESPTPASLAAYFQGGQPTMANITLDAKKMIGIASYSYESNEDSVIAILPMLQSDLGDGAAAAFERAVLNGDSDGAHFDVGSAYAAGANAGTAVEGLYDGIRKHGLAVTPTNIGAALGRVNFLALRGRLGKYGVNPNDLAILVSPLGYNRLQAVEEQFRADARGGNDASIRTGTVPSFNGIRVIVTEHMPQVVAATGINDGVGATEQLILTNLTHWMVGTRRGFTVEVTSDPLVQTNYVVASFRRAFVAKEAASASIPHTVIGTNFS
jgi:hypothetical protein